MNTHFTLSVGLVLATNKCYNNQYLISTVDWVCTWS